MQVLKICLDREMFGGKPKRSMAKLLRSDFFKKNLKYEPYYNFELTPENLEFCKKIINYKEWYHVKNIF